MRGRAMEGVHLIKCDVTVESDIKAAAEKGRLFKNSSANNILDWFRKLNFFFLFNFFLLKKIKLDRQQNRNTKFILNLKVSIHSVADPDPGPSVTQK